MNAEHKHTAIRASLFSMLGNTLLAIVKGLAGVFGNSYALIADAIESTSDIFSSALVLLGIRYANKPPDEKHPYGHGRIEPLIAFIVVLFLIISATAIGYKSIININTPHQLPEAWTLYVLGVIIVWKEISYQYVLGKSKKTKSSSLRADAWHHRTDAITSIAAFIGISLALWLGDGYEAADDWAALFAAGFIVYNSYLILRPAFGEIMDEHAHDELEQQIRRIAQEVEGIEGTEKCLIRKSGMIYHVDLHAFVNGRASVHKGHELAHKLQDTLRVTIKELGLVSIHIEPTPQSMNP